VLAAAQSPVSVEGKVDRSNRQPTEEEANMKPSAKTRSQGAFFATAILTLLLFAAGASALADWMPDDSGLPVDIAAPAN
jgi:hypothetical protein